MSESRKQGQGELKETY